MTRLAARTGLIKPSVTLAIAAKAGKLRAEGVDVVNFSAGEPDFDTPENIKAAAVEAIRRGMTKYTDVRGIEPLREAITETYRRDHDLSYGKKRSLSVAAPSTRSTTFFRRSLTRATRLSSRRLTGSAIPIWFSSPAASRS